MSARPSANTSLLLAIVLGWALVNLITPTLLPVIGGGLFALVLAPMQKRLSRNMPSGLVALLLTLVTFVGILLPLGLMIWMAVRDGVRFVTSVNWNEVVQVLPWERIRAISPVDLSELRDQGLQAVSEFSGRVASFIGHQLQALPQMAAALLFAMVSCFFFLKDGARLRAWIAGHIPLPERTRESLIATTQKMTFAVVTASLATSAVQSLLVGLAFVVCGLPKAAFVAAMCLFVAMIPVIGAFPFWAGGAIYLFVTNRIAALVVMLIFGAVITLSDNLIKPLIIRGRSPMHTLVILIAVFGGVWWLGPMGLFLGPIITAVALTAVDVWAKGKVEVQAP